LLVLCLVLLSSCLVVVLFVHVVACFVLGPSFLLSCRCSFCPYYDKVYCAGADIPEAAPIL